MSKLFTLVVLFAWSGQVCRAAPPNIVIVLADDLNADSIGCYGNPDVKTPNIDNLARAGMRFTQATTATAMCAPTRQMLYTGIYPVKNGAYPNHSRVKPGTKSLVHHLRALGYRVGLQGKRHFGPAASFPFAKVGAKFNPAAIRKFVTVDREQPFCLIFASSSPHVPWTAGNAKAFNPKELSVPEYWVDTPETRQAMTRYYGEIQDLDRQVGECQRVLRETGRDKDTLFIFTSEQGAQFPGSKWTCYEAGLRVGFIVRWPGTVKAGSVSEAWISYVDVLPTLIEAAGGKEIEGLDGRSFHGVLLGKTESHNTVAYGVHTQKGAIGSPPDGFGVRSVRIGQYKYIMNLNHRAPFTNALTTNDKEGYWESWLNRAKKDQAAAKLVARYLHRPAEELYDLESDPHELNNLAGDAKYGPIARRLRSHLQGWMKSQGDHGQATELAAPARKKRAK